MSKLNKTQRVDVRHQLWKKQHGRCYYCGVHFVGQRRRHNNLTDSEYLARTPTIDHIVPLSKGGKNSVSNFVLACHRCNVRRGNKSFETFNLAMEARHDA